MAMESDETSDRIRGEALRLFCERGYGSANIEDIAAAAEVGVATLYRRWPDKPALANDIYARGLASIVGTFASADDGTQRERFLALWLRLWEWACANRYEFLFVESHLNDAFLNDENRERKRAKDTMAGATLAALELGVGLPIASALVLGTMAELLREEVPIDRDEVGDRLWAALS